MVRRLRYLISRLLSPSVSGTSLTRDTRVGLALTAAFLLAFGSVLLRRLRTDATAPRPSPPETVAQTEVKPPRAVESGEVAVVKRSQPPHPAPAAPANLPLASVPPEVLKQIIPEPPDDAREEGMASQGGERSAESIQDLPGELVLTAESVADTAQQEAVSAGPGTEAAPGATTVVSPEVVASSTEPGPTEATATEVPSGLGTPPVLADSAASAPSNPQLAEIETEARAEPKSDVVASPLGLAPPATQPDTDYPTATTASTAPEPVPSLPPDLTPTTSSEVPTSAALASDGATTNSPDGDSVDQDGNPTAGLGLVGPVDVSRDSEGAETAADIAVSGTTAPPPSLSAGESRSSDAAAGPGTELSGGTTAISESSLAAVTAGGSGSLDAAVSGSVGSDDALDVGVGSAGSGAALAATDRDAEQTTGAGSGSEDKSEATYATYRVRPGDSLWIIARRVLGAGARWREIYELNRDVLKSPHRLRPGIVLKLPIQSKEVAQRPTTRPTRIR